MVAFYLVIYFPYREGSVPARILHAYLELQAWLAGACLGLVDPTVAVDGTNIGGRFPLRIVLDCAALDAVALFAAAVLAFPAAAGTKALGLLAGAGVIVAFNVGRIVFLYFAGTTWPASFDLLHEDVMQLALILVAAACFVVHLRWSGRRAGIESRGSDAVA